MARRDKEETILDSQDMSNDMHHEHIGAANKSDVSPNTPKTHEAD